MKIKYTTKLPYKIGDALHWKNLGEDWSRTSHKIDYIDHEKVHFCADRVDHFYLYRDVKLIK